MRLLAIAILVGCGSSGEPSTGSGSAARQGKLGGPCDAILTAEEVTKACGVEAVIDKTVGEGMSTNMGAYGTIEHLCYRDITLSGAPHTMGFVVNRTAHAEGAVETNRELSKRNGSTLREINEHGHLSTMQPGAYAERSVLGARGQLMYKVTDLIKTGKPLCSDDGMIAIGRLIDERVTTLDR